MIPIRRNDRFPDSAAVFLIFQFLLLVHTQVTVLQVLIHPDGMTQFLHMFLAEIVWSVQISWQHIGFVPFDIPCFRRVTVTPRNPAAPIGSL